ncbi:MAG TPA: hypothetical protein ENJ99_06410 [Rhizobiales bacterium]|nr:hypothetical protein [Hyphomicrobiales bacterium]
MTAMKHVIAGSIFALALATPAGAGPNCTCRYAGNNYKTGAIMCIRGKLSKCGFVLNNTAWKTIADTCPQVKNRLNMSPYSKLATRLSASHPSR